MSGVFIFNRCNEHRVERMIGGMFKMLMVNKDGSHPVFYDQLKQVNNVNWCF